MTKVHKKSSTFKNKLILAYKLEMSYDINYTNSYFIDASWSEDSSVGDLLQKTSIYKHSSYQPTSDMEWEHRS